MHEGGRMTRAELLAWARAYVAADTRFQAARASWATRASVEPEPLLAAEYRTARTALEAAEASLDGIAAAILEHVPDATERHYGRDRWSDPKGRP